MHIFYSIVLKTLLLQHKLCVINSEKILPSGDPGWGEAEASSTPLLDTLFLLCMWDQLYK